jgi:hypothetical protein
MQDRTAKYKTVHQRTGFRGMCPLFAYGDLAVIVLTSVPGAGRGCRDSKASASAGFSLRQNSLEVKFKEIEDVCAI